MIVVCSYCRKKLGEKEPYENKRYTHGMCSDCHDKMMQQLEGISFDEYLEEFEFPVVIVDDDGRLAAANDKALAMFEKPLKSVQGLLGGEALECAYARLQDGCGNTVHCPACTIRMLVNETREKNSTFENRQVSLATDQGKLLMTVSTSNANDMVRLVIKEVRLAEGE